ncbi:MAG: HD domain-containing protein [Eubacterium sp.]|nr:HD domain-containing protein [Eubacterium sp.]
MMSFLRSYQLDIMLALIGICAFLVFLVLQTDSLSKKRKTILILIEISEMFLLVFDRFAYIYRGQTGDYAGTMVRLSNFMTFLMIPVLMLLFNLYISDLFYDTENREDTPRRAKAASILSIIGMALVVVSQFTGLYYTIDASNTYHRSSLFFVSYIFPVFIPVIQFTMVFQIRKKISRMIYISVLMYIIVPLLCAVIQLFSYGVSLTNISFAVVGILFYNFAYWDINEKVRLANKTQVEYLRESQENALKLFDQTTTAFVNAIDARDEYGGGHSVRVAQCSKKLAKMSGKTGEECEKIYYAALLHDVGKIGIPDSILQKPCELTPAENRIAMQNPLIGDRILSEINVLPYLAEVARHHKERFDGTGYPDGLSGEDIPESARIVAIAEGYDSLISKNRMRDALPKQIARETLMKESGFKYDPKYTAMMLQLIDSDSAFDMRDDNENVDTMIRNEFVCDEYRDVISYGINIVSDETVVSFHCEPNGEDARFSAPSIILFDSLDGRVHDTERSIEDTSYVEFMEVWFDGHEITTGARNSKTDKIAKPQIQKESGDYEIRAARYRDHVRLRLYSADNAFEVTVALPDNSRFVYIGLTGEKCRISDIKIEKGDEKVSEGDIPRIAEEISYIDRLESDVPNIQIDGNRTATTRGIRIGDETRVEFHTMSLPTSNLVWHCPSVVVFSSDDMTVGGKHYREYALVRFDGEEQDEGEYADNVFLTETSDEFVGWEEWKNYNKKGYECKVTAFKAGSKVMVITENFGINIKNTTTIKDGRKDIYLAITGDHLALTDIRIYQKN